MNIDLTQIALALIALLSAVITGYVIPLLKSKVNAENGKLTESQANLLKAAIRTAVYAAEQIYKSDEGQKKKNYVYSILEQQGYRTDTVAIDAAIEAAVKEMKTAISEAAAN